MKPLAGLGDVAVSPARRSAACQPVSIFTRMFAKGTEEREGFALGSSGYERPPQAQLYLFVFGFVFRKATAACILSL
jgi:hypothetical protein